MTMILTAPRTLALYDVHADADFLDAVKEHDPVMRHDADDYGAALYPVIEVYPDVAGYVLWWNDYVANEWAEFWPTLPLALARFALLVDAADGTRWFTGTLPEFADKVRALFDAATEE